MGELSALRRALRIIDIPWGAVARAIALGTGALGSAVALGAVSAWLIARASQMPPVLSLTMIVVSVRAFGISRGVFRYLERLASHQVALRTMGEMRTRVYERLAAGRIGVVTPLRRGELLARVGADIDHVGDVVVRAIIPAAVSVSVSLLSITAMAIVLPAAGVFLAVGLILATVVGPALTARGARRAERDSADARADVAAQALDLLEHAPEVIATGRLGTAMAHLRASDDRWQKSTTAGARSLGAGAAAGMAGMAVAVLGAIMFGVPAVTAGSLPEVALAVIVLTPLAAFESTMVLPAAAIQMYRSAQAASRLVDLWDTVGEPSDAAISLSEPTDDQIAVQATDLMVGWSAQAPAIAAGSFVVPRGSSLMITGPSGTGKTNLLATLAGIIAPRGGTVALRGRAVFTAEDAHVFHTTVLENLRVARGDVSEDEARRALDLVGLAGWLSAQPKGLDTMIGQDATTISGGERRRLLIARAIVSRTSVLLIDEPGEHLDSAGVADLVGDLLTLPHRTAQDEFPIDAVVIASHHLQVAHLADQVLSLGTPAADYGSID